jgi:hypothetical protein
VRFINLNGMAFIGPGSEWFWTAVSGLVLAVTFIAIYRQLRLQASASAFDQLRAMMQEWSSERLLRCRVELLQALRDGMDPAKLPTGVINPILDYWETVGLLVRNQHVSRQLVWDQMGNVCEGWWATLKPSMLLARKEQGDPTIGENFAWLAGVMADLNQKLPVPPVYNEVFLPATINARLANAADTLRLVRSLRAPVEPEATLA